MFEFLLCFSFILFLVVFWPASLSIFNCFNWFSSSIFYGELVIIAVFPRRFETLFLADALGICIIWDGENFWKDVDGIVEPEVGVDGGSGPTDNVYESSDTVDGPESAAVGRGTNVDTLGREFVSGLVWYKFVELGAVEGIGDRISVVVL